MSKPVVSAAEILGISQGLWEEAEYGELFCELTEEEAANITRYVIDALDTAGYVLERKSALK